MEPTILNVSILIFVFLFLLAVMVFVIFKICQQGSQDVVFPHQVEDARYTENSTEPSVKTLEMDNPERKGLLI